jgi:hypothetical protein
VDGGDEVGAFLQVAGARIVAEARPGLHHVFFVRGGERGDIRPPVDESAEIGLHSFDGRLLQHDFGEPHPVGIGPVAVGRVARADTPRQVAMMLVVPGEQPPRQILAAGRAFAGLCGYHRLVS